MNIPVMPKSILTITNYQPDAIGTTYQPASVVGSDYKVADVMNDNSVNHDDKLDYLWNTSDVIPIILNGNTISVNSSKVIVDGSKVSIISSGTYSFTGSLSDGQIIVNTTDQGIVRIILNGVNLINSTSSPIYIESSAKTLIVLTDGTENFLTDPQIYVFPNVGDEEPNAAIFSKDGLIILSGTISISAVDYAIRGKNYLVIKDANLTIITGVYGLKSDNDEDTTNGYKLTYLRHY